MSDLTEFQKRCGTLPIIMLTPEFTFHPSYNGELIWYDVEGKNYMTPEEAKKLATQLIVWAEEVEFIRKDSK